MDLGHIVAPIVVIAAAATLVRHTCKWHRQAKESLKIIGRQTKVIAYLEQEFGPCHTK